jgi:beta-galactosidase
MFFLGFNVILLIGLTIKEDLLAMISSWSENILKGIARISTRSIHIFLLSALVLVWLVGEDSVWSQSAMESPSKNVAELTDQIRIGTDFFLNRIETKETIHKHFQLMRKYGITIARIFIVWDDIERKPGEWNFEAYDWIYDAAAENNIKIAATLCSEDPPGWRKLTPFYHHRSNLNDPDVKKYAAGYLEKVVGRYKSHPAQGPWLLMNEPALKYNFEPSTMQAFGSFLEQKWGSVEELNKKWFQPLEKFSDVKVAQEQWEPGWTDYYSFIDWKEFNIENLCQHLRWIKEQIRLLDPVHPTHLNQPGLTHNMAAGGQDPWQEGKIVEFVGASIHPAWLFSNFKREEAGFLWAYSVDLLASSSGSRPWWVTELQSGLTAFTGRRPMNPTPGEMTRWLWDSFGAGAKAVVYWCWHPRTLGNEGGEWGLVSIDGKPSNRAEATRQVSDQLQKLPYLSQAKPSPARVAILYNRETLLLSLLDGRTQTANNRGDEPLRSLLGCYWALYADHVPTTFIDIPGLKAGAAKNVDLLYLPYSYAMDDQALSAIRNFVSGGGTVWADGLTSWKNEYGEVRTRIPGGLEDVFGVEVSDIDPVTEPYSVTASEEKGGQAWRLPLELKGARVLLRDGEGKPFATTHQYHKGTAIYYASAVSLAVLERRNPTVRKWISGPALEENASTPVQLIKGSPMVSFRALDFNGGKLVILSNWGKAEEMTIRFQGQYGEIIEPLTEQPIAMVRESHSQVVKLQVPAGAVVLLEAKVAKPK